MNLATFVTIARPNYKGDGASKVVSDDDVIAALREPAFAAGDKPHVVALASWLLAETTSNRVRNAAAFFLADQIGAEARDHVLPLLKRPDLAQSTGSLLFALNEVGAKLPLDLLLQTMEHGSLEAQAEALTFMEEERIDPFTSEEGNVAKSRLAAMHRQTANAMLSEAAALALEYLDEYEPEAAPDV